MFTIDSSKYNIITLLILMIPLVKPSEQWIDRQHFKLQYFSYKCFLPLMEKHIYNLVINQLSDCVHLNTLTAQKDQI